MAFNLQPSQCASDTGVEICVLIWRDILPRARIQIDHLLNRSSTQEYLELNS